MKHFTISCDDNVYDWLEMHPEINKSGLFQKVIKYMIANGKTILSEDDLDKMSEKRAKAQETPA